MSRMKRFFKSIKNKVIIGRNERTEHKTSSEDLVFIESTDEQTINPLPYVKIITRYHFMTAQSFPPPIRHERKDCLRRESSTTLQKKSKILLSLDIKDTNFIEIELKLNEI
jgi:hypothetical protein